MATTLLLLLVLAAPDAPEGALKTRLEELRTVREYEEVKKLSTLIEGMLEGRPGVRQALRDLCWIHAKHGHVDEGAAIVRRNLARVPEKERWRLHEFLAATFEDANRIDEAVAAARKAVQTWASPNAHENDHFVRLRLAALLMKAEKWSEAIVEWRKADHPRSWCGTCSASIATRRKVSILHCRYHLGEQEAALEGMAALLAAEPNGMGSARAHWPLYLELAARAGRLARAKTLISEGPEKERRDLPVLLAIAEGFVAKKPAAILDALGAESGKRPRKVDLRRAYELAWTFLAEMGTPAIEEMSRRIVYGNADALHIAGTHGTRALVPALEDRLQLVKDRSGRSSIESLIWRINRRCATDPR